MSPVTWLLRLGAGRATINAGRVLDARRRAEAEVDAVANRLVKRFRPAA